ncbi:DUF3999 family protein [Sphingomonas sp. OK281]|uniref:DUF3999 family protein n=1 Tax=Sphingomonas sp. OK281 TaxID=1881067 RepID=UPI0008F3629C|nr:DUF3999 family protein [Sphingomonas sp. OK281]SFN85924.1 Protein of unknown function [Sphingomonas sp. OK281]
MRSIRKVGGLALAVVALIAAAPAGSNDDPQSYARRIPIVVAPGSTVQRLTMPAAVLAASRTATLSDIRVFDAAGRPMPIARVAAAAGPARRYDLSALPILGAADALTVTGVSLRLDGAGNARVAQVDGTPSGRPVEAIMLGILLDARTVAGSADTLTLDADVPRAQPVTFTVEASADLQDWRSLGEQVVYRTAGTAGIAIKLGGAVLDHDYLRVTWRAASRLLAPVTIRKAALLMQPAAAASVSIAASLPPLGDAHAVEFEWPSASVIDTLGIITTGNDVLVPVRVFGRDDREQPWTLIGSGTAARATAEATPSRGIALNARAYRTVRIEADQRSTGFTSPPAVRLGFSSRAILFLAAGKPPYILTSGRANAPDVYLPAGALMSQASGGPVPSATTAAVEFVLRLAPVHDATAVRRQTFLWGLLLAATALLAAMAWVLWKRSVAAQPGSSNS